VQHSRLGWRCLTAHPPSDAQRAWLGTYLPSMLAGTVRSDLFEAQRVIGDEATMQRYGTLPLAGRREAFLTGMREVLLPGLASLQSEPARAREYYLKALRFEFLIFAPAAVFMAVFARDLVLLVYGEEWLEIVPLVQVLTPLVLFSITRHTVGAVFLSQGRPDTQLWWSLLMVALVATFTMIGSPWGLLGSVTALSTLEVFGWLASHRMANRLIELPMRRFLGNLLVPFVCATVFGGLLLALRATTGGAGAAVSWPGMVARAALAVPLYAAVLHALDAELSRSLWRTLADTVRGPRPTP